MSKTPNEEVEREIRSIFTSSWEEIKTKGIPSPEDLILNRNYAKHIDPATVLYADLNGSTAMVNEHWWGFSADVYSAYIRAAARIIKAWGGVITAYDGDRIMGIFVGERQRNCAVRAALAINWAVQCVINPEMRRVYQNSDFTVRHIIGIDHSPIHAVRIGVKNDNDIVWIGRAPNYAAKLTERSGRTIWITERVFSVLSDDNKLASGVPMWDMGVSSEIDYEVVYGTNYYWQ